MNIFPSSKYKSDFWGLDEERQEGAIWFESYSGFIPPWGNVLLINCTARVAYCLLDMKIHLDFEFKRQTHPSIPSPLLITSGHKAPPNPSPLYKSLGIQAAPLKHISQNSLFFSLLYSCVSWEFKYKRLCLASKTKWHYPKTIHNLVGILRLKALMLTVWISTKLA